MPSRLGEQDSGAQRAAELAVTHPNFPKPSPHPLATLWPEFPSSSSDSLLSGAVRGQTLGTTPGTQRRQRQAGCPRRQTGGRRPKGCPAVAPPLSQLSGLLRGPAHAEPECGRRPGLPRPQCWKAAGTAFPRGPHPLLHVGRAVPTAPLTCAAAAARASLKSPSGVSSAGPRA